MKNNTKKQNHRQKHVPERSCIACRGKRAKRELIRLVGNADAVQIDPKGKDAGRGAYLCPIRECWETGLKGNRLEHTLRVKLTLENRQVLVEYGKSLPERESRG
ncbi:MAG: YlxR family protein [Dehalococcoidia bacterium]|nr:YlxR family protein [Dehalococcoidia bacterium]